ncbi:MAG: M23 family metallopeptidase [Anaerolineae bacterium]|nr:M23 family metallopeptidase [Anaerolineae bacterium]
MPEHVSHIILLPQGADWEWYQAIRNYMLHFRVTVTQSADDAGSFHGASHTITVVDVPGGWPGNIVDWLKENYPDAALDVVQVSDTQALTATLNGRVETGDRYGERQVLRLSWPTDVGACINQHFASQPWLYRRWPQTPGHEGTDIYAPRDTPLLACADGDVYFVDVDHPNQPQTYPYGNQVRVKHLFGKQVYRTIYAHLKRVDVQKGDRVVTGQQIGVADATGNVVGQDGSHLHLSFLRDGAQTDGYRPDLVDPELYLVWPDGRWLTPDESLPHLYGVHEDADHEMACAMRDGGVHGYILWTEGIGADPDDPGGGRDYASLVTEFGHTAVVRLNHGYDNAGTIPHSSKYADFAKRCANWVARSQGCKIWVIGNEPNNPREHPLGQQITPERFAECFNLVYEAIKDVQPDAVVTLGAIDPTSAEMGDCRQYFLSVLDDLDAVDGIALHAYTHGPDPRFIISDKKFDDPPLTWQYYHFRMFETFMAAIPESLRHLPVYITETNHLFKSGEGDHGWVDQNEGWVWAMYQRVDEWNRRGGQQIHCALLYRYPHVDDWVIRGKGLVIQDFQQVMGLKYRPYLRSDEV